MKYKDIDTNGYISEDDDTVYNLTVVSNSVIVVPSNFFFFYLCGIKLVTVVYSSLSSYNI